MQSPLERAMRERLAAYLADETPLDEFKDWLVGATWDVDEVGDPASVDLTYAIKSALAEQSSGIVSEAAMRAELRDVLYRAVSAFAPGAAGRTATEASSRSTTHRLTFPRLSVGTARAWVSAS